MQIVETPTERRLALKLGERENVQKDMETLHESLNGGMPSDAQESQLTKMRSDLAYLDTEIDTLSKDVENDRNAAERSAQLRRAERAARGVADTDGNGQVVYRSLGQLALDQIVTSKNQYARAAASNKGVSDEEIQRASERLEMFEELER